MGLKPETSHSLGMGLFFFGGNSIEIYTLEDSKKEPTAITHEKNGIHDLFPETPWGHVKSR